MSWQATAWVSTVEAGGPSGKLLLYALANYADEHGRCWPSDARLMADTEMAERTIRDWKRKLQDLGLLVIERRRGAGGTFQADEIRLKIGTKPSSQPPADIAGGDAVTTGKSPHDHRHLTAAPPASDCNPPTPPYKAEPSEEPSIEPIERGARESDGEEKQPEDPKRIDADGWSLLKDWPGFAGMPKEPALRIWRTLNADERAEAQRKFPAWLALLKAQRKSHTPAPSSYFGQKLFREVPEPVEAEAAPVTAAPFGKMWSAIRLARLLQPCGPLPRPGGFIANLIEQGGEAGQREQLAHQARHGWRDVNAMHDRAANRHGLTVLAHHTSLEAIAAAFEQVRVGSERWDAWQAEHIARGWPWLPDPGAQDWVYFPAGGPEGLNDFEAAVRGIDDDGGGREAAE